MKKSVKKKNKNLLTSIVLSVLGLSFMYPLVWMFLLSFKEKTEVTTNPFGLPAIWHPENYVAAMKQFDFMLALTNSIIYTMGTCVVTIVLGSMVAYAVTRTRFRLSNQLLFLFTLGLVIPISVVMIPLYSMILGLGLKGSIWSMILPYSAFQLPSTVLMISAFLRGIPTEIEEAAEIDGCGIFGKFFRVILPSLKPAVSTRFVMIYMTIWNEFTLALVVANKLSMRPLPIALNSFFVSTTGTPHWGVIGAAMILTSLPSIIMYTIGNRGIENALTAGSGMK